MKLGLVGRILVAGGVVVAFLLVEFALFIVAVTGLRDAADEQRHAEAGIAAAVGFQKLILDLETGQRGYMLTGQQRFLDPWRRARAELPAAEAALRAAVAGTPLAADGARLVAQGQAYLNRWSVPAVQDSRTHPNAVRARVATGEGKRRVDAIRAAVRRLTAAQEMRSAAARKRVHDEERRGVAAGGAGIVVAILLFLGIVGYFLRVAVAPLRRLASATTHLARGDLETRVAETGAGEVAELARAFNTMATSLQRMRGELQQQVNVTRTVLDSTVDGICLTDERGEIVVANRPMIQFVIDLKLPREGTVQHRLLTAADRFTYPDRYSAAIGRITPDFAEPTMDEFEFVDSSRSFQGFTTPVVGDDGRMTGRVWTLREVTAEREADRLKDDFIATVSHELRTPMTSIVGFLEMLLAEDAGPLNDEQRRFLEIVMRSSQRLMRQVGDLLFISQLDSGGLTLHVEEVDLAALVREAVEQVAALARQREIALAVHADTPVELRADRERIAQVVGNLLSNAIKFTPPGGRVDVRARAAAGSAFVEVEDSGIGIPEAERERLFERFFRSSRATQQAIQGTGLGLAISKAIVDAHGGTIDASPAAGGGTCFRFELPLVPAAAELTL